MNDFQDYFYQKESDVFFVNEDTQRVGILNSNPDYTLDVNGTINTSNILGLNASVSNLTSDFIVADIALTGSNLTEFIQADIGSIDNINAVSITTSSNVMVGKDLGVLNTSLTSNCPKPSNGSIFGFALGGGYIDPSWIKTENDFMDTLSALWDLGQTGYDLYDWAQKVMDPNNNLGDGLEEAINNALSNGTLRVPWHHVNYKPIYRSPTDDIGIKGNLYLNESQSIYSLPSMQYTIANDGLNVDVVSFTGSNKILDVGTHDAYLHNITASNIIVSSNLQSTEINANEIITNTISGNSVRIGEFYLTDNGLYLGNPISNPLTSTLIIDNQGNYKGTIEKTQLVDLEAWNFRAMADGNLVFGSFGETSILNDPFASTTNPIFSIT